MTILFGKCNDEYNCTCVSRTAVTVFLWLRFRLEVFTVPERFTVDQTSGAVLWVFHCVRYTDYSKYSCRMKCILINIRKSSGKGVKRFSNIRRSTHDKLRDRCNNSAGGAPYSSRELKDLQSSAHLYSWTWAFFMKKNVRVMWTIEGSTKNRKKTKFSSVKMAKWIKWIFFKYRFADKILYNNFSIFSK